MKRIVVRITGMPFDPSYKIDDDTITVGDIVRVPGSGASIIQEGETGTVISLASSYTGPCKKPSGHEAPLRQLSRKHHPAAQQLAHRK